jgi:hypothetical protein
MNYLGQPAAGRGDIPELTGQADEELPEFFDPDANPHHHRQISASQPRPLWNRGFYLGGSQPPLRPERPPREGQN